MCDRVRKIGLMLGLGLVAASGRAGFTTCENFSGGSGGKSLGNGMVYRIAPSSGATVTASGVNAVFDDNNKYVSARAAMEVVGGVTSVIWIPANTTLKLNGGHGDKQYCGTPGILVPEGCTLFIAGGPDSVLEVTGGNGGSGASGGPGEGAYGEPDDHAHPVSEGWQGYGDDEDELRAGKGGNGGYGGGAGAVAIGGTSGNGGDQREAAKPSLGVIKDHPDEQWEGEYNGSTHCHGDIAGVAGNPGGNGGNMGTLYVLGGVRIVAKPGTGGAAAGKGGACEGHGYYLDVNTKPDYFVGAGGGGGGGGKGPAPHTCIGGGRGGAGGGGSGASGTSSVTGNFNDGDCYKGFPVSAWAIAGAPGTGGAGGDGDEYGETGEENKDNDTVRAYQGDYSPITITRASEDSVDPGGSVSQWPGGSGGSVGKDGNDANVRIYRYASAKIEPQGDNITVGPVVTQVTDEDLYGDSVAVKAVVYDLTFEVCAGEQEVHQVLLGGTYPQPTLPSRSGYVFLGYYSERYGKGVKYYDANGLCVLGEDNYWDHFGDMTLYAAWELVLPPSEPLVVKPGETNVLDGSMDQPQYVQDETTPLFTVEAGGCLVLKNLTVLGSQGYACGVIANAGEVIVSNCAFRSCGSATDGGLYRGTSGSRARFIRCTFDGCVANEGGAIAADASEASVMESTFCYNSSMTATAGRPGGAAVSAKGGARVNVVSCTFVDNFTQVANGAVLALAEGTASTSDIFNNAFQLAGNCTRQHDAASLSSSSGYNLTADPGDLTVSGTRRVAGVEQTSFKPHNDLRTNGAAEKVFPSGAWPFYELREAKGADEEPLFDQINQYPIPGGCGARTGNTLQHYINKAAAGDTISVGPGSYDAVTVDKRVTIVGTGAGCVVDGEWAEPCVTFKPGGEDAVWNRFTFQNGVNIASSGTSPDGGGWTTPGDGCYGIASNCVFASCRSDTANGGGAAYAREIAYSTFTNCTAVKSGGGTYGCRFVVGTVYRGNGADESGGASASDKKVRGCLFHLNSAKSGGGGSAGAYMLCTFAGNAPEDSVEGAVVKSSLQGCLLYANKLPTDVSPVESYELNGGQFVNASAGDFHLALRDRNGKLLTHDDVRIANEAILGQAAGWMDMDRRPFVTAHPVTGEKYLYAGCYAFAPFKVSGLVVTGTDEWYRDSNAQTSLREAIESAAAFAPKTNGTLTVTFDEQLFAVDDTAVFNFTEAQTDMRAFTNATLVVRGPTNHVAVIDGNRVARAFRIFPKNRVRFENLVFQNCFGLPYGTPQPGMDGGAVQNNGLAFFSNCVFRANRAGNNGYDCPNDDPPIGYGGALATGAGATSTVYAATFAGNRAAKGGAIWTADGGASHVFYSTFAGNIADGSDSVTDPQGGACAVERKTYLPNGGDLWLVNCLLAGNRVTKTADAGGAISGAKSGLVLLNSVIVGNFANNATNDIAMPSGSTSHFYYTAYGTRTPPPNTSVQKDKITYVDLGAAGGVAYADAIGLTKGTPVVKIPMPQTVLPIATGFALTGTNVWTTADYSTLGYGGAKLSTVSVLAGGSRYQLLKSGVMRTINQLGESQITNGVVMLGPTTVTEGSARGADVEPGEPTPTYDDEDAVAEEYGVCYLVKIDGTTNYYATVEDALRHWQPGDFATVKSEDDEALNEAFFNAFDAKLMTYAETRPWYDYTWAGDDILKMEVTLNELAVPTYDECDFDMRSTKGTVSVKIDNVKPDLWYSLGRADSPEGPYVCDKWVQADDSGTLKDFLTAPKSGDSGFYRVIVAPYVR